MFRASCNAKQKSSRIKESLLPPPSFCLIWRRRLWLSSQMVQMRLGIHHSDKRQQTWQTLHLKTLAYYGTPELMVHGAVS